MTISSKTRAGIVAAAVAGTLAIAALAGTAVANAAGTATNHSPNQSTSADQRQQRPVEEALTGDAATKVKAVVEAKYPGATIERMEKDADGQSAYEAHITKADGTHVTAMLDANYAITGEQAGGPRGKGGHGDRGRHGHEGAGQAQSGPNDTSGAASTNNAA
jgi:uncharacterized membrane protein YkoI